MPCYFPLKAFQCQDKTVVFREKASFNIIRALTLPCGQCVGCRLERSRQWAVRCMHESSLHAANSFITLTYDDLHIPSNRSLDYSDFQDFMKRFKSKVRRKYGSTTANSIRFYMCGEYGENFGRPHFHALIFGFDFPDRKIWQKTPSCSFIYRSKFLEELWPFGYSSIGDVSFESAAYVARYVMKKITGNAATDHYMYIDYSTGEIHNRKPEFNRMSLKPGIGQGWIEKFHSDVYPQDFVVVNGKKVRPPRYYDRFFKKLNDDSFEDVIFARELLAKNNSLDNTPERLIVKAQVAESRLSAFKRKLK